MSTCPFSLSVEEPEICLFLCTILSAIDEIFRQKAIWPKALTIPKQEEQPDVKHNNSKNQTVIKTQADPTLQSVHMEPAGARKH